jgi:hypothetical protein
MQSHPAATHAMLQAKASTIPDTKPERVSLDEYLHTLEITSGIPLTADLIRRQYRLLTERLDPARLESHGPDFVKLARDKREKIEQAARALLESLGEMLEEDKKPEEPKDLRHNPDLDAVFGM